MIKFECLERGILLQPGKQIGEGPAWRQGTRLETAAEIDGRYHRGLNHNSAERMEKAVEFNKYFKSRVDNLDID